MKKVIIVPWTHKINLRGHKRVMDFVKTLPYGSSIALELDHSGLSSHRILFETLIANYNLGLPKRLSNTRDVLLSTPDLASLAYFDLYRYFRVRGIELYSLKDEDMDDMFDRAVEKDSILIRRGIPSNEAPKFFDYIEKRFAERIKYIYDNSDKDLYVIVGGAHSFPVLDILKRSSVNAEVTDKVFSSEKEKARFEKIFRQLKIAHNNKDVRIEDRLSSELLELSIMAERKDDVMISVEGIIRDIAYGRLDRTIEYMRRYLPDQMPKREPIITPYEPHKVEHREREI